MKYDCRSHLFHWPPPPPPPLVASKRTLMNISTARSRQRLDQEQRSCCSANFWFRGKYSKGGERCCCCVTRYSSRNSSALKRSHYLPADRLVAATATTTTATTQHGNSTNSIIRAPNFILLFIRACNSRPAVEIVRQDHFSLSHFARWPLMLAIIGSLLLVTDFGQLSAASWPKSTQRVALECAQINSDSCP